VDLRNATGCTVVALMHGNQMEINPDPYRPLPADVKLVLIGASEAEDRFLERYGKEIK
jgi:voltage-gated potassium channel